MPILPAERKTSIKPAPLKKGDRVGLVCPAGRPHSPSAIARSSKLIESIGLTPVLGRHVHSIHGCMAGDDEQRLGDLHGFFDDDAIRGIFALSGGYGSLRLLDRLDYDLIARKPKVILGGDENASWMLAVYAQCGLVSFYGPNLAQIANKKTVESLWQSVSSADIPPPMRTSEMMPQSALGIEFAYAPVEGVAMGTLIGGNLTALTSLLGTAYFPDLKDSILFLEDINERNSTLDRWLSSLYVAGELAKTRAVAFGQFDNCGPKSVDNVLSLEDLFGDRMRRLDIPCCFDLPIGQNASCRYTPLGVRATLDSARGELRFEESALSTE